MKIIMPILLALFAMSAWAADQTSMPSTRQAITHASTKIPVVQASLDNSLQAALASQKVGTFTLNTAPVATSTHSNIGGVVCPAGCYPATCGGVGMCIKNKPAPLCSPC